MGEVVKLVTGRTKASTSLPKPRACKNCGEPIETARLQVAPTAKRCIGCQRTHERDVNRADGIVGSNGVIIIKG